MDIHRKSRSVRLSEKSYEMLGAVGAKSVRCGLPFSGQLRSTRINTLRALWNSPLCTSSHKLSAALPASCCTKRM